jgi:hypothetical protein
MALQRISTEAGARKILQRLVDAGRCTVEDLDAPPPGHLNPTAYRNLLRDLDISETVQPINPRDLAPANTGPDFSPRDSSLSLPGTLDSSFDHHGGERQDPSPDGTDHEYPF